MADISSPSPGSAGSPPADEIIEEVAKRLDGCAAILRELQASQLRIDPEWTTVEIGPEDFNQLVDGVNTAAANLRGATKRDTP
jgi:hypothetical protein